MALTPFKNIKTALVIDENPYSLKLLTGLVRQCGINSVMTAPTAEDALMLMQHSQPDIIICDWTGSNGVEGDVLSRIRNRSASHNSRVPVVIVSAESNLKSVLKARDLGATEFVARPVSQANLYRALKSSLETPRPFVEEGSFFGPDRRRKKSMIISERRRSSPKA